MKYSGIHRVRFCTVAILCLLSFLSNAAFAEEKKKELTPDEVHAKIFAENKYPSADTCNTCHKVQYRQWSVSPHAYAQLSPVFNAMQRTVNLVTNATNGDFCIRCHSPIGMNLGEKNYISNFDRHPTAREGITCIVCHRVNKDYGKISGRVSIIEGPLTDPVYGPKGNKELARVLDNTDKYRVVTDPKEAGRQIHKRANKFFYLATPGFCGICHDVNLINGFRLEEAFSEYKHSPSATDKETCQDCHMSKVQGTVSGYAKGPAAVVGDEPTMPRKLTNHMFAGPEYSVIHPGLFPHNAQAKEMATMQEWLQYDYKAGWGTDEFEDNVPEGYKFPKRWASIDDRYDARDIINDQQKLLKEYFKVGTTVLKAAYKLGKFEVVENDKKGLKFKIQFKNATKGHNAPTGFIGERMVFLRTTVTDSNGKVLLKSGDLDPNGDVRDSHSAYVHDGKIAHDDQLFSLQSLFLTRMIRGGEREQILPVNYSPDPLPFIRPSTNATILTGRPVGARIHRKGIRPLDYRWAKYHVDADALKGSKPPYKVDIKIIAGMIPINLVNIINVGGYDYGMTKEEVAKNVVAGHRVLAEHKEIIK